MSRLSLLCFLLLLSCQTSDKSSSSLEGIWIDLTYEFSNETIYWPTSDLFQIDTVAVGLMEAGFYYESYKISTAEHGGTHLDAPIHFSEGKQSTEEIPLDRLIGPALIVDVTDKVATNRDYLVSVEDLVDWEAANGMIEDGSIILIRTGYGKYWPDPEAYLGTALRGPEGVAALHFPGLGSEAATWLVENRNIDALGIDTASIDRGQSATYDAHQILFKSNIPAFENVANLDQLPVKGSEVIALPMKIKNGSGGPLRIIARISGE